MTPGISGVDESRLVALIEQVYDAATDSNRWEPFLVSLADSIGGTAAHFLYHDLSSSGSAMASARHHPDALRLYNTYFHQVDALALTPRARAARAGDALTDEMLLSRADLKRTEYFNDFAARLDETRSVTLFLHKTVAINVITILRRERDAPFDHHDVRVLEAMTPHLQRALQIHQRIRSTTEQGRAAAEGADALPCGMFLVDADAKVVFANRLGKTMLAARDGLSTDRRRLTAAAPADAKRLREMCAAVAATRGTFPRHPGAALRLRRPSGRHPLEVLVTSTSSDALFGATSAMAMVFVTDPTERPRPNTTLLEQAYGLTPAEADVAAQLAAGRNLREIADERRATVETVRQQHKQILAKTGTRSRGELVRHLTIGLSAVVREDGS